MICLFQKTLILSMVVIFFLGCESISQSANTLEKVAHELEASGFVLWYPAESDATIRPGMIWDNALKTAVAWAPQTFDVRESNASGLKLTREPITLFSIKSGVSLPGLSNSSKLEAVLSAEKVESLELNLEGLKISRIALAEFLDLSKTSGAYRMLLDKAKNDAGWYVITGTLKSSGLIFKASSKVEGDLSAITPQLQDLFGPGLRFKSGSSKSAEWLLSSDQVIGITAVGGPDLADAISTGVLPNAATIQKAMEELRPPFVNKSDNPIASNFSTGDEGWKLSGSGSAFITPTHPQHSKGQISGVGNGLWYFLAPDKFRGNLSTSYGKQLSFKIRGSTRASDAHPFDGLVAISGGGKWISWGDRVKPRFDQVATVRIDDSEEWLVSRTPRRVRADEQTIKQVLVNVQEIRIFGQSQYCTGETILSDVRLDR